MLSASALQTKRIQSGASLTTDQSHGNSNAAPANDKGKGKGKGKAKGKLKTKVRERERRQMKGKELDTSRQHLGYVLPLPDLGNVTRMDAHFSMCLEDNCVKLSEVMQDRYLRKLQLDSSQRAQSVGHHKERKGKVKAKVKANQMPCPRKRMMARFT